MREREREREREWKRRNKEKSGKTSILFFFCPSLNDSSTGKGEGVDRGEGEGEDGGIKGNGLIWNENSVETRRSPGNRDFAGGLTSALPVKPARIVPLQRSPPPPFVRSRAHTKPLSSSSSSPSSTLSVVPTRGSTTATWPTNLSFHPPRTPFFFSFGAFFSSREFVFESIL